MGFGGQEGFKEGGGINFSWRGGLGGQFTPGEEWRGGGHVPSVALILLLQPRQEFKQIYTSHLFLKLILYIM